MHESLEPQINEILKNNHLEKKVKITGFTTLEQFNMYMNAADICFNLRYPYNGESSGSLMRLLGKGKCTVVNRIGSFAEIPENACIMLDNVDNMTPQEEIDEISNAIKKALDLEIRRKIEKNAMEYAKKKLDIKLVIEQYWNAITKKEDMTALNEILLANFAEKYACRYTQKEKVAISNTLAFSITGKYLSINE